jgi:hypothetical protein
MLSIIITVRIVTSTRDPFESQHFPEVGVPKVQLPVMFALFLIEGTEFHFVGVAPLASLQNL